MGELASVILPVYNIDEPYLRACLDSVLAQTYANIEVIAIDDGSTNGAGAVLDAYALADDRVRVEHGPNRGVSCARNRGLELSRGAYVCFVDPDDWVDPTYVAELVAAQEASGADLVMCDGIVFTQAGGFVNRFLDGPEQDLVGERKGLVQHQLLSKGLCAYYPPEIAAGVPWAKLYARDFLERTGLRFVEGMARMQDNIFNLYAMEEAGAIRYLPRALYHYRRDGDSASYRYNLRIVEHFERYFEETRRFLDRYHKPRRLYDALAMKTLTSVNSYLVNYYFNGRRQEPYRVRRKEVCDLLRREPYASARARVEWSLLRPQERVFVFALRHLMVEALWAMVTLREARWRKR